MNNRIAVIGGGFAGLAAACTLAREGHNVHLFEKNETTGGRARHFIAEGFVFDMGPSWYWMPEIFESFFNRFGKSVADYYELSRLDPSYRVFFSDHLPLDVPADTEKFGKLLEKMEPGAEKQLQKFLREARIKYETGMGEFVWKPSLHISEFARPRLLRESLRLQLFTSMRTHIRKHFRHPKIIQLLEFPVLFLGARPSKTPALYSMMNYADIALGTWYPKGGMLKIAEAMTSLAEELGVKIHTGAQAEKILVENKEARGLLINGEFISADVIVATADYHHVETTLLEEKYRSYSEQYWNSRVLSPSTLLFFIGVKKKVNGLLHHNLFFDQDFNQHAAKIYDRPGWPENPLFYLCLPSKSDSSTAPEGGENIFALIPVAPGLTSDEATREQYLNIILRRLKAITGEDLSDQIVFKRSYAHEEFISDYNSFRGNAYGLANTLRQTAFLKPRLKSKKVGNLFYAGQLTTPGPGVPPSLISGQVTAAEVHKYVLRKHSLSA